MRTMKRRRRLIAVVIALALLALWLVYPPTDRRFGEPYYDGITEGMSEADVEAILGLPAGDYRPERWIHPGHFVSPSDTMGWIVKESGLSAREVSDLEQEDIRKWADEGMPNRPAKFTRKSWIGKNWGIGIELDENGRVIQHDLFEVVPPRSPGGFFAKIKWYIGL